MSTKRLKDHDHADEEDAVHAEPKDWVPAAYQRVAVKWLLEHAAAGIFADPGLRKTSITLAAIKILRSEGLLSRVLIIAPLRPCYGVWDSSNPDSELRKWTNFHSIKSVVLHGSDKDRQLELGMKSGATLFVMNYEGLDWLMASGRFQRLKPDTLIADESTKLKNTKTQRFKRLEPALSSFNRRWILTGTPTPKGLMDLFGQVKVLDLGAALGRYITHYRMQFFDRTGFGGLSWAAKKGAEDAIYERLSKMVYRIDGEASGIDLPKLVDVPLFVDLPYKARQVYNELENDLFTTIHGHSIRAANAAVASVKCAQVANGGLYLPAPVDKDGIPIKGRRKWSDLHEVKIDAVEDLHEELHGKPILITYDFEHDLARLRKRFGDIPAIGGETNPKESRHYEKQWNAGKIDKLAIHPASTHGLNPQEGGNHLVWHSLTHNLEHYEQTWRRLVRSGQKSKRVFNHLIMARDTVDEAKLASLRNKDASQRALLDALLAYSKRRRRSTASTVGR